MIGDWGLGIGDWGLGTGDWENDANIVISDFAMNKLKYLLMYLL